MGGGGSRGWAGEAGRAWVEVKGVVEAGRAGGGGVGGGVGWGGVGGQLCAREMAKR
jgi:hypothetical protein